MIIPDELHMTWVGSSRRWTKKYRDRWFAISCKKLGVPGTKEESWRAANAWWDVQKKAVDAAKEDFTDEEQIGRVDLSLGVAAPVKSPPRFIGRSKQLKVAVGRLFLALDQPEFPMMATEAVQLIEEHFLFRGEPIVVVAEMGILILQPETENTSHPMERLSVIPKFNILTIT